MEAFKVFYTIDGGYNLKEWHVWALNKGDAKEMCRDMFTRYGKVRVVGVNKLK